MGSVWWKRRRHPNLLTGFLLFVSGFALVTGLRYFAAQENTTVYDRYPALGDVGAEGAERDPNMVLA